MDKKNRFGSRMELQDYMRTTMSKSLSYRRAKHYDFEEASPKMYILESYHSESTEQKYVRIVGALKKWKKASSIKEIEPGELVELTVVTPQKSHFYMYLDFKFFFPSNRFIMLFSLGSSNNSDSAIRNLVDTVVFLDNVWFDNSLYKRIDESIGQKFRAYDYQVSHSYSIFESRSNSKKMEALSDQISEKLRKELPIYSDRFWRAGDKDYTAIEAYYHGKLVFWGEDFDFVVEKAMSLERNYNEDLTKLEGFAGEEYLSSVESEDQPIDLSYLPEPIMIRFDQNINIQEVSSYILSGLRPFKIFGLPFERREGYLYSFAFDKHVGNPIGIEITSNEISLYLYPGGCANTIKRFYRNFQEYIVSNAELYLE